MHWFIIWHHFSVVRLKAHNTGKCGLATRKFSVLTKKKINGPSRANKVLLHYSFKIRAFLSFTRIWIFYWPEPNYREVRHIFVRSLFSYCSICQRKKWRICLGFLPGQPLFSEFLAQESYIHCLSRPWKRRPKNTKKRYSYLGTRINVYCTLRVIITNMILIYTYRPIPFEELLSHFGKSFLPNAWWEKRGERESTY